jgi:hypothetical protein
MKAAATWRSALLMQHTLPAGPVLAAAVQPWQADQNTACSCNSNSQLGLCPFHAAKHAGRTAYLHQLSPALLAAAQQQGAVHCSTSGCNLQQQLHS